MYKTAKDGKTRFGIKAEGARMAFLAGDFNGWKRLPMQKQLDGSFAVTLTIDPGTYQYKFFIDGQWVVDPDQNNTQANTYGTLNSVLRIQQQAVAQRA